MILEGHCPAEIISSPNQTHLSKLISVFQITKKLQAGEFIIRVGAKLKLPIPGLNIKTDSLLPPCGWEDFGF